MCQPQHEKFTQLAVFVRKSLNSWDLTADKIPGVSKKRTVFLIRTIKNTILFYFTLYRISLASLIRHCRIHTGLLGCSVLEEFLRYSREQRVG